MRLSFLSPGNYPDDDPRAGLEDTLALFALGEELGFDGAWIRQRHLEHGVSSAAVFLAAASQRTRRIDLGVAVIPIGYESPFRLGEDLATVDVLSGGRLQAGLSAGVPPHAELLAPEVFGETWRDQDFSYARIERLAHHLRGPYLGDEDTVIHSPGNVQRPRLQPHSPSLPDRLWYGGSSLRSVQWAGDAGFNLLAGNIVSGLGTGPGGGDTDHYATAQLGLIGEYRKRVAADRPARVAVGRVILPTDSADAETRKRYQAYAESRHERTLSAHGEKRILFAPDLVGPAEWIAQQLLDDVAVTAVEELRLELPYEFGREDYEQVLTDTITLLAPALG